MLKLLIIVIFMTTLLHANNPIKICHSDMNNMIRSYHSAEKFEHEKNYAQALEGFMKSNVYSHAALESCENSPNFDFNVMYDYIIASVNKIYEIHEVIAVLKSSNVEAVQ